MFRVGIFPSCIANSARVLHPVTVIVLCLPAQSAERSMLLALNAAAAAALTVTRHDLTVLSCDK